MGNANAVPDSLTPRRLTTARTVTKPTDISTAYGAKDVTAEVMATTPETTDTATVIT